jgi:hypothetical protein
VHVLNKLKLQKTCPGPGGLGPICAKFIAQDSKYVVALFSTLVTKAKQGFSPISKHEAHIM